MQDNLKLFQSCLISLHALTGSIFYEISKNGNCEDKLNKYVLSLEEKILDLSKIANNVIDEVKINV